MGDDHLEIDGSRSRRLAVITLTAPFRWCGYGVSRTAHAFNAVRRPHRSRRRQQEASSDLAIQQAEQQPQQQQPWQRLLEGPLARPLAALQRRSTPHSDLRSCFPLQLCRNSGPTALTSTCHELASAGTRMFGDFFGGKSPIKVRIYDFALYFDAKQAQKSRLSQRPGAASSPAFAADLRSSADIDMSLVVRASRNLPLALMKGEYERILRRRLTAVGGSPDDAALQEMLSSFREEDLPRTVLQRGSIQRGSVITFVRGQEGRITASAGGVELASVRSPHLAAALFDLYIGEQPVSKVAKETALASAAAMLRDGADYEPPAHLPGVCARQATCVRPQRPLWSFAMA